MRPYDLTGRNLDVPLERDYKMWSMVLTTTVLERLHTLDGRVPGFGPVDTESHMFNHRDLLGAKLYLIQQALKTRNWYFRQQLMPPTNAVVPDVANFDFTLYFGQIWYHEHARCAASGSGAAHFACRKYEWVHGESHHDRHSELNMSMKDLAAAIDEIYVRNGFLQMRFTEKEMDPLEKAISDLQHRQASYIAYWEAKLDKSHREGYLLLLRNIYIGNFGDALTLFKNTKMDRDEIFGVIVDMMTNYLLIDNQEESIGSAALSDASAFMRYILERDARNRDAESALTLEDESTGENIFFYAQSSRMLRLVIDIMYARFGQAGVSRLINKENVQGDRPLDVALRDRAGETTIRMLIDAGADTTDYYTAVDVYPFVENNITLPRRLIAAHDYIVHFGYILKTDHHELVELANNCIYVDSELRNARDLHQFRRVLPILLQIGLNLSYKERFDLLQTMLDDKKRRIYTLDSNSHERTDEALLIKIILNQDVKDEVWEGDLLKNSAAVIPLNNGEHVFSRATNPFALQLLFEHIVEKYGDEALKAIINEPEDNGTYPIMFPVMLSQVEAVDVFLRYGADPRNAYSHLLTGEQIVESEQSEQVWTLIRCAISANPSTETKTPSVDEIVALSPSEYTDAYNDMRIPTALIINASVSQANYAAAGIVSSTRMSAYELARASEEREMKIRRSDWFRLRVFIAESSTVPCRELSERPLFMRHLEFLARRHLYMLRPYGYIPKSPRDVDMSDKEVLLDIAGIAGLSCIAGMPGTSKEIKPAPKRTTKKTSIISCSDSLLTFLKPLYGWTFAYDETSMLYFIRRP